jgi:hypothetical protein
MSNPPKARFTASVISIVAAPGQEEEYRAAAAEYQEAEEALAAAYRVVSEAKYRKRRATEKLAQYAVIQYVGQKSADSVVEQP